MCSPRFRASRANRSRRWTRDAAGMFLLDPSVVHGRTGRCDSRLTVQVHGSAYALRLAGAWVSDMRTPRAPEGTCEATFSLDGATTSTCDGLSPSTHETHVGPRFTPLSRLASVAGLAPSH